MTTHLIRDKYFFKNLFINQLKKNGGEQRDPKLPKDEWKKSLGTENKKVKSLKEMAERK